ncbi:hypothetical protein [Streptomyces sp. NPDC088760]|uniref:hypothetical protein n=1 Tax=Streptomyces sp. NPDC088760 TaxID=3365890 RepID=UPI0037FC4511
MAISKRKNESTLVSGVVVVSALIATLTGCGEDTPPSDAAPTEPSATASHTADSPRPVRKTPKRPKIVTMSLEEIAGTPSTFRQFKAFVAEYGTQDQKRAVKHLKGWRGYKRKAAYPALEATSDYPTVDYEAIDGGDAVEQDKMLNLEKQGQYIAEAFAAWWKTDEKSVLQVYDRSGIYAASTACIRTDSAEKEGSCF